MRLKLSIFLGLLLLSTHVLGQEFKGTVRVEVIIDAVSTTLNNPPEGGNLRWEVAATFQSGSSTIRLGNGYIAKNGAVHNEYVNSVDAIVIADNARDGRRYVTKRLPWTIIGRSFSGDIPGIDVSLHLYRKRCTEDRGKANGDDITYKSQCYRRTTGLPIDKNNDQSILNSSSRLNLNTVGNLPGTYYNFSLSYGGGRVRINGRWRFFPPSPDQVQQIGSNQNIICSDEDYTIGTDKLDIGRTRSGGGSIYSNVRYTWESNVNGLTQRVCRDCDWVPDPNGGGGGGGRPVDCFLDTPFGTEDTYISPQVAIDESTAELNELSTVSPISYETIPLAAPGIDQPISTLSSSSCFPTGPPPSNNSDCWDWVCASDQQEPVWTTYRSSTTNNQLVVNPNATSIRSVKYRVRVSTTNGADAASVSTESRKFFEFPNRVNVDYVPSYTGAYVTSVAQVTDGLNGATDDLIIEHNRRNGGQTAKVRIMRFDNGVRDADKDIQLQRYDTGTNVWRTVGSKKITPTGSTIIRPGGTLETQITLPDDLNGTTLTGLSAGRYRVRVSDNLQGYSIPSNVGFDGGVITQLCTPIDEEFTIKEPQFPFAPTVTKRTYDNGFNIRCRGQSNGEITVNGVGGIGPYTYVLRQGATERARFTDVTGPRTFTNRPAGTYQVDVYDGFNNLEPLGNVVLTQPPALSFSDPIVTKEDNVPAGSTYDVKCHDGTAVISTLVSGQNGDANRIRLYTSTTGSAVATASKDGSTYTFAARAPGTYQVRVEDTHGYCTSTFKPITISGPSALVTSAAGVNYTSNGLNIQCHEGIDGRIRVNASGGVAPYTIVLSAPGVSISNATQTLSAAGNYTYSGLSRYRDGSTSQVASYSVTITDANDCVKTHNNIQLTEPDELILGNITLRYEQDLSFSHPDYEVKCAGDVLNITAVVTGGNRPAIAQLRDTDNGNAVVRSYTLPAAGNLATFTGVPAGNYNVIVNDNLTVCGSTPSVDVVVREPDPIIASRSVPLYEDFPISCHGADDGRIVFEITSGGIAPYTLEADNGSISTEILTAPGTGTISGRAPGTYSVKVIDDLGCELPALASVNIEGPPDQFIEPVVLTNPNSEANYELTCFGDSITATVVTVGGNFPHSLTLTGEGGTTFDYSSQTVDGIRVTTTYAGLPAFDGGQYQVYLEAENSACTDIATFFVRGPDSTLTATATVDALAGNFNVRCPGDSSGTIRVVPKGGLEAYEARLFADGNQVGRVTIGDPGMEGVFSNLPATNSGVDIVYTIEVEDRLGCTTMITEIDGQPIILTEPDPLAINPKLPATINGYHLYCATDLDTIKVNTTGGVFNHNISLFDAGNQLLQTLQSTGAADLVNFTNRDSGTYYIRLTDQLNAGANCVVWDTVRLEKPQPLQISNDGVVAPTCYYTTDGEISLSASLGIPKDAAPYTFDLYRPADPNTIIDSDSGSNVILHAGDGNYIARVTDKAGCTNTVGVLVENRDTLKVFVDAATTARPECYLEADGYIGVYAIDGTPFGGSQYGYNLYADAAKTTRLDSLYGGAVQFTDLPAEDYYIEVVDSFGCIWDADTVLSQPDQLQIGLADFDMPTCYEGSDGWLTVQASGGTRDYFYATEPNSFPLAPTAGDFGITDLGRGTYAFYLRDTNYDPTEPGFCETDTTFFLPDRPQIQLRFDIDEVTCFEGTNGAIRPEITQGGVNIGEKLRWEWFRSSVPYSSTDTLEGVPSGNYALLVTDTTNNCVANGSVFVPQPARLILNNIRPAATSCRSESDGSVTVSVTGGTPGYTYFINDTLSSTLPKFEGISSGNYTISVVDRNGCTDSSTTVVEKGFLQLEVDSLADATCYGAADGYLRLAVTNGGGASYEYSYDGGTTWQQNDIFRLPSGQYTFLARETYADPCYSKTVMIEIDEPDPLRVATSLIQASSCGQADGQIALTASGGSGQYDTLWRDTNLQTVDPLALTAGTYLVTIEDITSSLNCAVTDTITLVDLPAPALSYSLVDSAWCGQAIGSIMLSTVGGTGQLRYELQGRPQQSESFFDSLQAGIAYQFTVTDERGCSDQLSVLLQDGTPLTVQTVSTTQSSCGQTDGALEIIAQGGVAPYSYSWPDSVSTEDTPVLSSLSSGLYTVTITDAVGCTTMHSVAISDLDGPQLSLNSTAPYCGLPSGTAAISVTGGTGTIRYSWTGPDGFTATTDSIANLLAGTYSVTIRDDRACNSSLTFTLSDDASQEPALTLADTSAAACGQALGTAEVLMTGGLEPYEYAWFDATMTQLPYSTQVATGLLAGNYTVIATDAKGCSQSLSLAVGEKADPILSYVGQSRAACGLAIATAEVRATGGTGSFTYFWSDEATQQTALASQLGAGVYTVYAQDSNGCQTNTITVTIEEEPALLVEQSQLVPAGCEGKADGVAAVIASGGVAPYTYLWDDPDAQTTAQATGLAAGSYTVSVTDANGCTTTRTVTVGFREALAITEVLSQEPDCYGDANGKLSISLTGGTQIYDYLWSNGATTSIASNLPTGQHWIKITDRNTGCTLSDTLELGQPDSLYMAGFLPTSPVCYGDCNGALEIQVAGGTANYTYAWSSGAVNARASALCAGQHQVTVTDNNGCTITETLSLENPPALAVRQWQETKPSCSGDCNGKLSAELEHGMAPYLIMWSDGQIGSDAIDLCAGTHQISVMDSKGCEASFSYELEDYPELRIDALTMTPATCYTACDGTAMVTASGGDGNLSYSWSSGATGQEASGLCAGTYTVTVKDGQGCETSQTFTITQPELLELVLDEVADPLCTGTSTGVIQVSAQGGNGGYTYAWPDGNSSARRDRLAAGRYTITVTDSKGCTANTAHTLTDPLALNATTSITPPTCNSNCDGAINLTVAGGTGNYSYNWSRGDNTANLTEVCAGDYSLTIMDENGCTLTLDERISAPDPLRILSISGTEPTCFEDCDGSLLATVNGGTAPYTYSWSSGATTATASGLCAGNYTLTVTDAKGCIASRDYELGQPEQEVISNITSSYIICEGQRLTLDAGIWRDFNWSSPGVGFNSQNRTVNITEAGNYTLQVHSFNGCLATTSFTVETTTNLFDAEFLMATEAEVGDTVEIIEVTIPQPQRIQWSLESTISVVERLEDRVRVIFNEPGTYNIGFEARDGDCSEYLEKAIRIYNRGALTDRAEEAPGTANKDDILLEAYPNPSTGHISIRVTMESEGDIYGEILDLSQGRVVGQFTDQGDFYYRKDFDFSQLPKGVYIIRLVAQEQNKTLRFTLR